MYIYIYIFTHVHIYYATELLRASECWYDSLITCARTHHQAPRRDSQDSVTLTSQRAQLATAVAADFSVGSMNIGAVLSSIWRIISYHMI